MRVWLKHMRELWQVDNMDMYALTPKGVVAARSTNGITDPSHPDYAKWQIIYKLKFLHYADKEKLAQACGISPAMCALALANLRQHGYVAASG